MLGPETESVWSGMAGGRGTRIASDANGVICLLGREILVPLTTSLYVPGKLASTQTVLVDVGTGFYVEKVRSLPLSWREYLPVPKKRGGGVGLICAWDRRHPKQHENSTPPR